MANNEGKRFKDFEGWSKIETIKSTEELVKLITQMMWRVPWRGVAVEFCDTTKESLSFFGVNQVQDFFDTLGEFLPEEIHSITFYQKEYDIYLENWSAFWDECWHCGCVPSTLSDELYRELRKSANYGKNQFSEEDRDKLLINTNYGGKNQFLEEDKNKLQISANYGRQKNEI